MQTRRAFIGSAAASLAVSCGAQENSSQTIKWRFGHALPLNSPGVRSFEKMFSQIEERTDGQFKIEISAMGAQGFKQSDSLRLVAQQKVYDLVHHFPDYVVRDEPLFAAGVAPLHSLIDAAENAKIIQIQRDIAQKIASKWGLDFIAYEHVAGDEKSVYILSNKPFESLDDLKSIKLRHWSRTGVEIFRAVGVPAQVIPASDLYLALQNSTVDATVVPLNYAAALSEVTKYAAHVTPFIASTPSGFLARKETWAALPDAFKEVWKDVTGAQLQADLLSYKEDAIEPELLEDLQSRGIKLLDPLPAEDRRILKDQALLAWRKNAEKIGPDAVENYERILNALDA